MQLMMSSPEITCDHCIATIREAVEATEGARFVSGDPAARTFVVEVASGAALDALGVVLASAGYAPGDIPTGDGHATGGSAGWRPGPLRIERTAAGANVNYDCYCGCDAGFALDRAQADPAPESCCCGNLILVGPAAAARLTSRLEPPAAYRVEVEQVTMPWGQPVDVAIAIPLAG